jgi:putative sterol carrier protein
LIGAINADPESREAGKGLEGGVAGVVLAEPPFLKEPFAVWANLAHGRLTRFRVLEDLDEIEEIEPDYVVSASYGTWKLLITGELDPVEALAKRLVRLAGDMQPIIERAEHREVLRRALSRIETTFADSARLKRV